MMPWSACLLRSATDQLGPHQSARPTASYTISWDSISLSLPDVQEVEPEAEDHPEQRRPIARCDGVRWWPYPVYQRHDHCHDAEQRPKIEQEGAHHSPSPQLISSRTSAN
ncbi:hypothetical protein SDC9_20574 [bioreactor metagenome]|uniref:Uncharacterized protein n=1 Tax=bioreactor metagenome TaxID=1076179 RepID=A0A644U732_9ZZZZ